MTRRQLPFLIAAGVPAMAQQSPNGDWILNLLRTSMETKKGVTLHVKGQAISMIVTAMGDQFVEGRNQQASKIVVRLASIDAAILA